MYVNRLGKRMPKTITRLIYTGSYVILPYLLSKAVRKLRSKTDEDRSWLIKFLSSYSNIIDTITNIHVALFYFQGLFYSISKRFAGMRYVFGHNKDANKLRKTGNYSVLGCIILLQFAVKLLIKVNQYSDRGVESSQELEPKKRGYVDSVKSLQQLSEAQEMIQSSDTVSQRVTIDLSDPTQLPYIPSDSRSCMLCLSFMVNPSAANCGHIFCWECIVGWIREQPECPLCRQVCMEQNLLPLR